jgi:glutathione S-transferase
VLTDGDLVLYETAAIVLHLCDTHPQAKLSPDLGTAARAHFYKWLMWCTNTLQSTLIVYFYPERWVEEGNADGAAQVKARAQAKVTGLLDQLDALLAGHGGPWILGREFSALDAYVFTLGRWTRNFQGRKARDLPHLGPYLQRMSERPGRAARVRGRSSFQRRSSSSRCSCSASPAAAPDAVLSNRHQTSAPSACACSRRSARACSSVVSYDE